MYSQHCLYKLGQRVLLGSYYNILTVLCDGGGGEA